ncbi:FlaD/FlaE family flagellar protein [Methanoculleus chikugoensis]|uniref:Archaeal flagella protein FlaD/E domain-containing protein n=1 Tax=Methanoculleus chikugoensis TaxID=118126 RepID=A0ABM7H534_9EURY|nr:FlaD/FlaE family flagellar protein [Methanoculleus chikugoensis]BBL67901.1 hypothetical protein MchiMG62_10820 [Methanoculleus chikugoensis]
MVGVDQAQIDKILSGASSEDPEARLDTLEKELDFVKTSIKRLLIDLRERMNELDNPFTSAAASYTGNRLAQSYDAGDDEQPDDEMPELDAMPASLGDPATTAIEGLGGGELFPTDLGAAGFPEARTAAFPQAKPTGKLKLQKVHRLFEWVHRGCSRYGHEHMAIMIDAYRSMGYITEEVSDQIGEIMRMAPETRRDVQEIGPNEFVSELYILNRILDPDDATLDRDMIEVLMLSRRDAEEPDGGKTPSKERNAGDTWIELLDRI